MTECRVTQIVRRSVAISWRYLIGTVGKRYRPLTRSESASPTCIDGCASSASRPAVDDRNSASPILKLRARSDDVALLRPKYSGDSSCIQCGPTSRVPLRALSLVSSSLIRLRENETNRNNVSRHNVLPRCSLAEVCDRHSPCLKWARFVARRSSLTSRRRVHRVIATSSPLVAGSPCHCVTECLSLLHTDSGLRAISDRNARRSDEHGAAELRSD